MDLDFHQLAEETLDLCRHTQQLQSENTQNVPELKPDRTPETPQEAQETQEDLEREMDRLLQVEEEHCSEKTFPEGPGLFFRLDKGTRTFCLRGIASENMAELYEQLKKGDFQTLGALKLSPDDIEDDWEELEETLMGFSTEDQALAEVVADQMFNRRFPLDEDTLCNLADPGFSWWLSREAGTLEIYFKSHGLDRAERFYRLGPMGDQLVAQKCLADLQPFLESQFEIDEFSMGTSGLKVVPQNPESKGFQNFLKLFQFGEMNFSARDFKQTHETETEALTHRFYLRELAALRRFWCQIEEKLGEKKGP